MAGFLISFLIFVHARDLDRLYESTKLKIGDQIINVYLADTEEKREKGLMFIEKMPENTGMLFVFEESRPLSFWMKNTLIPLAIGFLDSAGQLNDVQEMTVPASMLAERPPPYPSAHDAQFALEMNKGWFTKHQIKVGKTLCRTSTTKSAATNSLLKMCR